MRSLLDCERCLRKVERIDQKQFCSECQRNCCPRCLLDAFCFDCFAFWRSLEGVMMAKPAFKKKKKPTPQGSKKRIPRGIKITPELLKMAYTMTIDYKAIYYLAWCLYACDRGGIPETWEKIEQDIREDYLMKARKCVAEWELDSLLIGSGKNPVQLALSRAIEELRPPSTKERLPLPLDRSKK